LILKTECDRLRDYAPIVTASDFALNSPGITTLTGAQARILAAALNLFARHGVGGTSLQMIADEIGVTKAAVYHQYNTKEEIVLAAAELELSHVETVLDEAEARPSKREARDTLIAGMVDLAIAHRREMGNILTDPVIAEHFATNTAFAGVMNRLRHLLLGDEVGPAAHVRTAMLIAAISGAAIHPFVADLDDEVLRAELLRLARRFLGLPN
jgi:AcrR family transcriptional regulator